MTADRLLHFRAVARRAAFFPGTARIARSVGAEVFLSTWKHRGAKMAGATNRSQLVRLFGQEYGVAPPRYFYGQLHQILPDLAKCLAGGAKRSRLRDCQRRLKFPRIGRSKFPPGRGLERGIREEASKGVRSPSVSLAGVLSLLWVVGRSADALALPSVATFPSQKFKLYHLCEFAMLVNV